MRKALDTRMNELHNLVVEQAIRIMQNGRPLMSKGEPVLDPEGNVIYVPPTAAEITAAARILKDNGIDTPIKSHVTKSAEEEAMSLILSDLKETTREMQ